MSNSINNSAGKPMLRMERDEQILFLWREGLTYRGICDKLAIPSTATVHEVIHKWIKITGDRLAELATLTVVAIFERCVNDLERVALMLDEVSMELDLGKRVQLTCDLLAQKRRIHDELIKVLNIQTLKIETKNMNPNASAENRRMEFEEFRAKYTPQLS